jgi:hypothetical protein
MKAGEAIRWCYRHHANLEFDEDEAGVKMTVTVKRKKSIITRHTLLLRNHDTAADEVSRFLTKLGEELNLE